MVPDFSDVGEMFEIAISFQRVDNFFVLFPRANKNKLTYLTRGYTKTGDASNQPAHSHDSHRPLA